MKWIYVTFLIVVAQACTVQQVVKPLEKGKKQVSGNFGGPLIGFAGTTIPIPLTSIGYAQGISDSITLHANLQLTSIAYKNIHLNTGATYGLLKPNGWKPGISTSVSANILTDVRIGNWSVYPQIDINSYWDYNNHFMYFGLTNWIELSGNKAHNEEQQKRMLTGIQFGNTWNTNKWSYSIESKWLAPTRNTEDLTINYKTYRFNNEPKGAVGIYFGLARKF